MRLVSILAVASALGATTACRTSDSVVLQGEEVRPCDGGDADLKGWAFLTTVADFSVESAVEAGRAQIIEKHGVPEALQAALPIEAAAKCGNVDDNTLSVRVGVNVGRFEQKVADIKRLVDGALTSPGDGVERFKRLMIVNRKVTEYNAAQKFLQKQGVTIAAIPATGAVKKFYDMRDHLKIGLKFSEKNQVLEAGNVTRNVFKKAFVDMGLRPIEMEKMEGSPDIYFSIEIRYESLSQGANRGQEFIRLYATVAMEDRNFATVAAATLEAKGGGVDSNAAMTTALRSLEAQISGSLLAALIPDEA